MMIRFILFFQINVISFRPSTKLYVKTKPLGFVWMKKLFFISNKMAANAQYDITSSPPYTCLGVYMATANNYAHYIVILLIWTFVRIEGFLQNIWKMIEAWGLSVSGASQGSLVGSHLFLMFRSNPVFSTPSRWMILSCTQVAEALIFFLETASSRYKLTLRLSVKIATLQKWIEMLNSWIYK